MKINVPVPAGNCLKKTRSAITTKIRKYVKDMDQCISSEASFHLDEQEQQQQQPMKLSSVQERGGARGSSSGGKTVVSRRPSRSDASFRNRLKTTLQLFVDESGNVQVPSDAPLGQGPQASMSFSKGRSQHFPGLRFRPNGLLSTICTGPSQKTDVY